MIDKGILSNDKPAICRMWSSERYQAQGRTPRRNASLAFRLERLKKFRYGVPPFQKVPVWPSGAFRLSLSTGTIVPRKKLDAIFSPLDTIHTNVTDRQTDTDRSGKGPFTDTLCCAALVMTLVSTSALVLA